MMSTFDESTITHQLAGMIADALPTGWTVDTSEELANHRGAYIDGPDGARLFLALDWRNADRLEIHGVLPRNNVYGIGSHKIGVGRDRGPAVIAREITRRLLPAYLPDLTKVQQNGQEMVQYRQERHALAQVIADIVGGQIEAEDDKSTSTQVRWYTSENGYGHVRIGYRADSISELEVCSTSPERILAALRALNGV